MPNNVLYNSIQQTPQQSQANLYNYQQQQQQQQQHRHHHHHHHHHHHKSPTPQSHPISSFSNHRLNNTNTNSNNHIPTHQTQFSTPSLAINQTTAYFLDRIDLENYTAQTLKQTVETILSKTKSKGLKVKISLPDDGLIIDNITDANQSWIFKTSELLYFWRDPYYSSIIIVVTINRARNHPTRPYSASIFRLRGSNSAQLFLEQAQQFFSNLSTLANTSKSNRNKSVEKLIRPENPITEHNSSSSSNKTKSKSLSTINEQVISIPKTTTDRHQSPQTATTPIRRVTRAEFDPGKTITHSTDNSSTRRTYSETTSSTDSQATTSTKEILSFTKKLDDDEDDKMTTTSNHLSGDQVAELMRELKELRNEIAQLKLSKTLPPMTYSMSTSPLVIYPEYSKQTNDSSTTTTSSPSFPDITSQSEIDAETQTDFSLINHRRRPISRKNKKTMIGSGGVSTLIKKKPSQSHTRNGRRTFSNSSTNTVSDQEETSPDLSSHVNDSLNDSSTTFIPEQFQPVILAAPPRPVLLRNQNSFMSVTNSTSYSMSHGNCNSNSSEEGTLSVTNEKERPTFLSTNIPSSNSELIGSSISIITTGATSFRSTSENSNTPAEHIYENVPILIQPNSNREAYYNIPIINADEQQQQQQQNQSDGYVYYTIHNNHETDSQQQYLIPGQNLSNSPPTTDNNSSDVPSTIGNLPQQKPQIISTGRHRNQPIYFANHLTNPIFNVDKQLLINTIANQFGVELHSPQLQQLITNQHLFVARKRTFANMVWQLTPDEETALCSSPIATQTKNFIEMDTMDSNNSAARSILKATKRFHSIPKRRGISWDSALE